MLSKAQLNLGTKVKVIDKDEFYFGRIGEVNDLNPKLFNEWPQNVVSVLIDNTWNIYWIAQLSLIENEKTFEKGKTSIEKWLSKR